MRFKINIGGNDCLLTAEQVGVLADLFDGCELLTYKSVKDGNGGSSYIHVIADRNASSQKLNPEVMSTTKYDALCFITKMQNEKDTAK